MSGQLSMFKQSATPRDVVFTPSEVSKDIIDYFDLSGVLLDPCRGDGSFFGQFPVHCEKRYCEISEGLDFFAFDERVNWIIGNPPYSIFGDFLRHSFDIAENVVYLVPTNKIFQSQKTMRMIQNYGGIRTMLVYGSGSLVGFPFGFSVGAFHFQRDYRGMVDLQFRATPERPTTLPPADAWSFTGAELAAGTIPEQACSCGGDSDDCPDCRH